MTTQNLTSRMYLIQSLMRRYQEEKKALDSLKKIIEKEKKEFLAIRD